MYPHNTLRLHPAPQAVLKLPYEDVDFGSGTVGEGSPRGRPYVLINTVSTVDAQISAGGKSGALGSCVDRAAMRLLRSRVDAVMIGAGTLRAERLSLGLDDEAGSRVAQPEAIILSASGEVPLGNLIPIKGQRVSVLAARPVAVAGADVIVAPPGKDASAGVDLAAALRLLGREHAVEVLLVEGGPTLNRALISMGLVDEFCLTLAPELLGASPGASPGGARGAYPATDPRRLELLGAYLAGDEIFLRYRVRR